MSSTSDVVKEIVVAQVGSRMMRRDPESAPPVTATVRTLRLVGGLAIRIMEVSALTPNAVRRRECASVLAT